jgi:hypothetical protein
MDYAFEIYIQKSKPEEIDWANLLNAVLDNTHEIDLEISFEGAAVNFHIFSKTDLSALGTKILPFVIKKEERKLQRVDEKTSKSILFFRLPQAKTILEIKEKEQIKNRRILKRVIWHIIKYAFVRASTIELHFEEATGKESIAKRVFPEIPLHLLQGIDWSSAVKYKAKEVPVYLKIEKAAPLFTDVEKLSLFEVEGFPYFTTKKFFGLTAFDYAKHSLIVGQTGVGKSKFISLFIKKIAEMGKLNEYAIVVIDPHASLFSEFISIPSTVNIDFRSTACDLFFQNSEPKIGAEFTIMLIKNLLKEQFTGKMEQVLKYAVYVLLLGKSMTLANLKRFLTEPTFRNEVMGKIEGQEAIKHYFDTEFIETSTKYYDTAIMPVLTLMDELNFLPAFGQGSSLPLDFAMQNNFVTCFSLSRIFLGDRATKLIAGLLIQQIFLIAQSATVKKKILLIIDEVPTVENDSLITILAEARKFDMSLFLSMQYLTQVSKELLRGIVSNTYNFFVFRSTEEDAKLLAQNLNIEIPDEVLKSREALNESKEDIKVYSITRLDARECIVRPYANGQFYPCFKGKTVDVK